MSSIIIQDLHALLRPHTSSSFHTIQPPTLLVPLSLSPSLPPVSLRDLCRQTLSLTLLSSSGFIKSLLPKFAAANPQIEFVVSPRPAKHPILMGHYINGRTKAICVRNMEPLEVLKKAELLRDASGEKPQKFKKPVTSTNPSVRGVWSPYHGQGMAV